jgi:hypothetical protein
VRFPSLSFILFSFPSRGALLSMIRCVISLCYLTHLLSPLHQATGIGSLGGLNGACDRLSSYVKQQC